ncbi:MAG: hypothetical protein IPO29_19680 [Anaerolineae bacterium]|nr:hypothetical protein [Anaerolineae bacterium]
MAQLDTDAPGVAARPILVGLARAIDAAAGALHAIARSRAATVLSIALLIGGIFAIGLQETGRGDLRVYDTEVSRISASMGGRYVRITGRLDTSKAVSDPPESWADRAPRRRVGQPRGSG